jgi:hypothetical protein
MQNTDIGKKGTESEPSYRGYFSHNFHLKTKELNNYRIKYNRESRNEVLILKINHYNPNLSTEYGDDDHIVLDLILEKKYES